MVEAVKIGVSACLLGEKVRWNGGHKKDRFITDTLGQFVDWVPVCPETECGLGIPRETLRLVGNADSPRLVTTKTKVDHTARMQKWAKSRLDDLANEHLCGFIFKGGSPSSGMERVKVYNEKGMPEKKGVGMFARAFLDRFPLIPVEEDGRLHDPKLREHFIEKIFVYKRWRELLEGRKTIGRLVEFHTVHKLLFLSHSPKHYREMGRWVAEGKKIRAMALYKQYETLMMDALRLKTTVKKNSNVLQHMMGYFKKDLTGDEKNELLDIFDRYRSGYVPLIVPITLMNHYVRKYRQPYLGRQIYLNPHPIELKLRNHA